MEADIKVTQQYCREMEDAVLRTAYHTAAAAGTPWHLDPDIDRAFVERVLPVPILHLGSTKPGDLADAERPAWRMTPVTIEFPFSESENPVPQFTSVMADLARQEVRTRDVGREYNPDFKDGGVLMVMWRKRPQIEIHPDGIPHVRARIVFSFMPRSFLGTEPNNGVAPKVLFHGNPDFIAPAPRGKLFEDLGKMYAMAEGEVREVTGIKGPDPTPPIAATPELPANPTANWWRKYYDSFKDSFADQGIAINEAAEFDWDAFEKKARDEARQRRVLAAREFLDKKGVVLNEHVVGGDSWFITTPKPEVERKPINVFDAVKAAARQARIKRNEMAPVPCDPASILQWDRWTSEANLRDAISRTELPHEATIHDRLMPYRHRED